MTGNRAERFHEIDMLKGLACVLMLVGHAVRAKMGTPVTPEKVFLHIMDFSGPIFFFVSGMNVMTFLERNGHKPGFAATRFYLSAAAALFLLGFTYNLNRVSPFMEIFQCVAMSTAVVYLLLRTRIPTWLHFIIIAVLYAVYLTFRLGIELRPEFAAFREARLAIPLGSDIANPGISKALQELGKHTGLFVHLFFMHFSLLPWVTFFYVGALCYRSLKARPERTLPWWIFFAVLFAVSPFLLRKAFPHLFMANFLDLMLRGIPSYVAMTLGMAGMIYLFSRRFYRGAQAYPNRVVHWFAERMEILGKESFLFLIVHWWIISSILLFHNSIPLNPWVRSALVILATLFAVPWFAALRDRWSKSGSFVTQMSVLLIAGVVLPLFIPNKPLALYATYLAGFAFAFVYPTIRLRLRRRNTAPIKAAKPAER